MNQKPAALKGMYYFNDSDTFMEFPGATGKLFYFDKRVFVLDRDWGGVHVYYLD